VPTEADLRKAVEAASIPARDYRVYSALLRKVQWDGPAVIPAKFQPRSLQEIAKLARMSVASAKRALAHLESHGWIQRDRKDPGRGHCTHYQLTPGLDCDCIPQRPEPASDADRARRYRQRKKAAQDRVTRPDKAAQSDVSLRQEAAQIDVSKRLTSRDDIAGQAVFSAGGRGKGEGVGGGQGKSRPEGDGALTLAACHVCTTPMDSVLTRLGYRTHPCCYPDEKPVLSTAANPRRST
jgi:hypothetical protein